MNVESPGEGKTEKEEESNSDVKPHQLLTTATKLSDFKNLTATYRLKGFILKRNKNREEEKNTFHTLSVNIFSDTSG